MRSHALISSRSKNLYSNPIGNDVFCHFQLKQQQRNNSFPLGTHSTLHSKKETREGAERSRDPAGQTAGVGKNREK